MRVFYISIILVALLVFGVLGEEKELTVKESIVITADNAILDKKREVTILTGRVVATSGKTEIAAEEIRAYGKLGEFTKIIADGNVSIRDKESDLVITGGHLEYFREREYVAVTDSPRLVVPKDNLVVTSKKMERFNRDKRCIATGEVVILKEDMSLRCGVSEYLEIGKKVILTCNPEVEVTKEGNRFSGDKIIYYPEEVKMEVVGNVKATITPKEEER
ncbi:MAG: LptA/OstA family protein [bacterium]|nr:LptA/OstA family protein [bacterium]